MLQAQSEYQTKILTFGGAFSNHIAATAFAGKENGFKTIGIIRGDELENSFEENPTLKFAKDCEMQFEFVSRENYRLKDSEEFLKQVRTKFGDFYFIPEGGTNDLAVKGCEETVNDADSVYHYICVAVGTGGTISGIINNSNSNQKILGFPALKGDFLQKDICKFATKKNWELILDYHFGGYGKVTEELVSFLNEFYHDYQIPLDPIYTGKLVFGVIDKIKTGYFPENSKILIIHTGGLQGIKGMNQKLKSKKLPILNYHD